jgi:hypothetical protein
MGQEKANGMDGNICGWGKLEKRGLEKEGLNDCMPFSYILQIFVY